MQAGTERTLGEMVARIVKRFAPDKIILFGLTPQDTPDPTVTWICSSS